MLHRDVGVTCGSRRFLTEAVWFMWWLFLEACLVLERNQPQPDVENNGMLSPGPSSGFQLRGRGVRVRRQVVVASLSAQQRQAGLPEELEL